LKKGNCWNSKQFVALFCCTLSCINQFVMEKNQQNQEAQPSLSESQKGDNTRPGQQLPTADPNRLDQPAGNKHDMEHHSESSFPQNDEETLGTP
jgi:hypothetical protein